MKKIVLLFSMIAFCAVMFGQNLKERKIQYFVDAATKEYSLNQEQQKELLNVRTGFVDELSSIFAQFKNGEITKEEQIEKQKNHIYVLGIDFRNYQKICQRNKKSPYFSY